MRKMRSSCITYYPPHLAERIIRGAVIGPANSKIPSPELAFLSFAYHALYHKGLSSGIPSTLGLKSNKDFENDYKGILQKMVDDLEMPIDINLESLDQYLYKAGWRPKYDTLAKIASHNEWVREYFFKSDLTRGIGLGVFILKQKIFNLGLEDLILKMITDHGGFKIIRTRKFNTAEVSNIADQLRGGWDSLSHSRTDFLPAMAVIVLNMSVVKCSKVNTRQINTTGKIKSLKKMLRKKFDKDKISLIHSTDFTHEAWEYIEDCFPAEADDIKKEIENICNHTSLSLWDKLRFKTIALYLNLLFFVSKFRINMEKCLIKWLV